nr:hypothetical protein CFP56_68771 [Quercus suber]
MWWRRKEKGVVTKVVGDRWSAIEASTRSWSPEAGDLRLNLADLCTRRQRETSVGPSFYDIPSFSVHIYLSPTSPRLAYPSTFQIWHSSHIVIKSVVVSAVSQSYASSSMRNDSDQTKHAVAKPKISQAVLNWLHQAQERHSHGCLSRLVLELDLSQVFPGLPVSVSIMNAIPLGIPSRGLSCRPGKVTGNLVTVAPPRQFLLAFRAWSIKRSVVRSIAIRTLAPASQAPPSSPSCL